MVNETTDLSDIHISHINKTGISTTNKKSENKNFDRKSLEINLDMLKQNLI
eukprot:CAMPEP_0116950998 /NCGR_PEP_ID=MMETSP0467-20121206/39833_1 /TAXON_ID=283647 /ORGANISM="Mesodinium pulex, Strain SPMC105" /LENGTH=50 /DNA_ID=CAMNT_0004635911 /DNA_START=606 /DNA_END=758 /DNA_ORIENTATION=+